MARGFEWLVCTFACSLIFLISTDSLEVYPNCKDELFVKLNSSSIDEAKEILNQVREKDTVKIGEFSVEKILRLTNAPCESKDLTDRALSASRPFEDKECGYNFGVHSFFEQAMDARRKLCGEKLVPLVKEVTDKFHAGDKKVLENFHSKVMKKVNDDQRVSKPIEVLDRYINDVFRARKTDIFLSCARFIERLSRIDTCPLLHFVNDSFITHWISIMERCREYLYLQCHTYGDWLIKRSVPSTYVRVYHRSTKTWELSDDCKTVKKCEHPKMSLTE